MSAMLIERMAGAEPSEVLASLERLISSGQVTMSEASEVYTVASRARMVQTSRQALANAIEWLIVAYLDGEGHASREGTGGIAVARQQVDAAIDSLIEASKRAAVARWRLETRAA